MSSVRTVGAVATSYRGPGAPLDAGPFAGRVLLAASRGEYRVPRADRTGRADGDGRPRDRAEAWDSGASAWTPDRRMRFANDLDVPWSLIAVSASSNRAKSDADPADWLPPLVTVRCDYAADWLAVKVRWSLAIDVRELAALEPFARECPDTMPVLPAP